MPNYLDQIILQKKREVEQLIKKGEIDPNFTPIVSNHFSQALKAKPPLAIIGEIKRRSPTAGEIKTIDHPEKWGLNYCQAGVAAISILTDVTFFGGSLGDLIKVKEAIGTQYKEVALLRKDFIIHPLQLLEAAYAGAHAVLLIVRAVKKELAYLMQAARDLGLEVLVEVHDQLELEAALNAGASIIGINHRNLETFEIDMTLSERLKPRIPSDILTVAESGIHSAREAKHFKDLGFNALLVGQALVCSCNPMTFIQELRAAR